MSATVTAKTNGRAPRALASVKPAGLMDAILAVQLEAPRLQKGETAKIPTKSGKEFTYKYLTLDTLMDAIQPLLGTHQLVWLTLPTRDENGEPALTYRLTHIPSGEAIEDTMPLLLSNRDPQGQGSALSYARRYALMAVLNLTAGDDDDGAAASAPTSQPKSQPSAAPAKQSDRPASAAQRKMLRARAGAAGLSPSELANVLLIAAEDEKREWADEDAAARWLARALDRLPARHVDAVIDGIEKS